MELGHGGRTACTRSEPAWSSNAGAGRYTESPLIVGLTVAFHVNRIDSSNVHVCFVYQPPRAARIRRRKSVSDASAKREVILDAAAGLFARFGFRKTSVADIIRGAGVARATVYKYFATKEDIFHAVIQREMQDMLCRVREEVEKESTTRDRLRAAVLTHTTEIRKKVNVYRVTTEVLSDVIPRSEKEVERLVEEALSVYAWILTEGVKAGEVVVDDVETTAWSIILAFKGIFMMTATGQIEERMTGVIDTLLDIIWNGLKSREEAA
jgi:AcrR family transcriptional regulator